MPTEQKYNKTRKRADKIGTQKLEPDKTQKKSTTLPNPIVTWLKGEWKIILALAIIFFISLFLRSYFYYPVATENGFLLSGNDPFYHKRVIDYSQQYFTHIRHDPLLDYPLIGANPRPPVYDWSNAVSGLFLSPLFGGDISSTTWYIFLFSPALWGALTIFPVYFLTRDMFGRKPALISAFFMGIMSSHIERSPLGFSDHDAMVVFFVVTSIFFLFKAIGKLKEKNWVKSWRNPMEITKGIKRFFDENPQPIAFSILCGISMATVALIWKGFPYVFVILMGSFIVLTFINHLRKVDSLGIFFCIYIAFAVSLMVSFPYYAFFTTGTWLQPLYMLIAVLIIGIFFVPTRDLPWIIVFPTFIILAGIGVTVLSYFSPEIVDGLFTGGGYFIKSKLYSTIAEAQAPDTSRLAISYGPVTFYLTLIGLVIAALEIPKHWKMDYFIIIVWCALAIYMAMSAVRFMFNATPVFAILSGWITWNVFERLDPTFRSFKKIETKFVYLYLGILTFIIMAVSYWWLYLENENYLFYQSVFSLGLLGLFIALFVAWIMLKYNFILGILAYVGYILIWFWYTFDVLIDQNFGNKAFVWDKFPWWEFIFGIGILCLVFVPIIIFVSWRHTHSGSKLDMRHIAIALFMVFMVFTPNIMFAIDASIPYEKKSELDPAGKTFGAFGHSFPSEYWQAGMDWLSEQDTEFVVEDRPAFISWWDYGFWALYLGEHPTVADNFQAGYQLAGSFIGATNETQGIALFAVRIIEGDFNQKPINKFSSEMRDLLIKHLDSGNQIDHPNFDKVLELYQIENAGEDEQDKLIKEVKDHPNKYGHLVDIKLRNAKYAAVRHIIETMGQVRVVDLLADLNHLTGNSIRYFAVDTRLFPFTASNTGIFYAPIKLADKDIGDYIEYYVLIEVRDNSEAEWRLYSDRPIPTEDVEDEIDLNDIVETHGGTNVRIKDYQIKYTNDFYNSMFYKCYIGYSFEDIYGVESEEMQEVPGIYGTLANQQPMQAWNMTHFRMVYRTAYWTPHNQTELETLKDADRDWEAVSELEAIKRIQNLESDGVDNDNNAQVDDRGEGGTWSPSYRGGGVFFIKYYHGAIIRGKVVTDSESQTPVPGVRVTVLDDFGIPHDMVYSDAEGNYNLTAPFGTAVVIASKDGYTVGGDDELSQRIQLTEKNLLNSSLHDISDQQAMRRTSNWIIESDMKIPVGEVNGRIYWELTNDENYNPNEDELITDATLILNSTNKRYNLVYETTDIDEEGKYDLTEVVPGEYALYANINGHVVKLDEVIEINSENLQVSKDFVVRPGIIGGNATFTNASNYLPGDITIHLRDTTNNTDMTHVLGQGEKYYSFFKLLPGNYTLWVKEDEIQHFETNLTLEVGENRTSKIDLIPVITISGNVYYSPDILSPLAGNSVPSPHVEFFNTENSSFNTVLIADASGAFSGEISKGNFSIYVHYTNNGKDYVHISELSIVENSPISLDLHLEPGFWINGRVTKQVNTSVERDQVRFIFEEEVGPGEAPESTSIQVPTNSLGIYRICLPYKEYRVEVYHTSTPGNITYTYYNSSSFLKEDITRIISQQESAEDEPNGEGSNPEENNRATKSRTTDANLEINFDIHVDEASNIWGYIYWDRNSDNRYFPDNRSFEDAILDNSSRSRSRQVEASPDDTTRDILFDLEEQLSSGEIVNFEESLSGPELEMVSGVRLKFTHENGSFFTSTLSNGYYSIFLPPGRSIISFDDNRFLPLADTNNINKTVIDMPFDRTYQPDGIARNFTVIPVNNTVIGYTWYDENGDGVFDINETIPDIPFTVTPLVPIGIEGENVTLRSDSINGEYIIDIIPGEYSVEIDYDFNDVIKYKLTNALYLPFKQSQEPLEVNIPLKKYILANISFTVNGSMLNSSNLANVNLSLYSSEQSDDTGGLSPVKMNITDDYYTGYITPGNYTVMVEYTPTIEPGGAEEGEVKYIYFGKKHLSESNYQLNIELQKPIYLILSTFVDEDNSGNFTTGEERPNQHNVTILDSTGAKIQNPLESNTLNQTLMPGTNYKILINDTITQFATHGIKIVRFIAAHEFSTPLSTPSAGPIEYELDLGMIKYYNISGDLFYDENENNRVDGNEREADVPIHFQGPMNFTLTTNTTGVIYKFVLPGQYFITLDNEGFLTTPVMRSINVSLENTTFDFEEIPKKVRVYGLTFYDAVRDFVYDPSVEPEEGEGSERDRIVGAVQIEFVRSVFFEPEDPTGGPPGPVPAEDTKVTVVSDSKTGEYEVMLLPGDYNLYSYEKSAQSGKSTQLFANLELRIIEHLPEYDINISLNEGRLVEGNVFYRDTDLNEVHDLYSLETGTELRFESLDTGGAKQVQYSNGIYDRLYLAYGNYTVFTEYTSEEYELSMDYTLQETIEVTPEVDWYSFELNKENDYTFSFEVKGDSTRELQSGNFYNDAYTLVLENEGNVFNLIDLNTEDVPDGWVVKLGNISVPLDITGQYKKVEVPVDITIPVDSHARNEIRITAIPRGDQAKANSVTLNVNTPSIFNFELGYESDLDRGIRFNDTILLNLSVKQTGNANDNLNIKFYNLPTTWNVSIGEAWQENADVQYKQNIDTFVHTIAQTDIYKNITIEIHSPTTQLASWNEKVTILVRVWSENKPTLEFTEEIKVTIRKPDLIMKRLKVLNADLVEGNNVTIRAFLENKQTYVDNVNFSLYIEDTLVENKTIDKFLEDTEDILEFYWDPSDSNITAEKGYSVKIRVVMNGDFSIDELDYDNNAISIQKFIGGEEEEEEFNWRLVYALISVLVSFLVIYAVYRWRRKI
jgi:asparagine N-glycosylation enzyme membrane subunit Stt3